MDHSPHTDLPLPPTRTNVNAEDFGPNRQQEALDRSNLSLNSEQWDRDGLKRGMSADRGHDDINQVDGNGTPRRVLTKPPSLVSIDIVKRRAAKLDPCRHLRTGSLALL